MTHIHTQNPIENIPNPWQHILALYLMWHWCLRGLARAAGVTAEVHTWLSTYTARKLFITCSGSREASHREAADERKGKAGMLISPKHTWMQTKTSHCRQILPAFFLSVSLAKLLCDFSHSFSELSVTLSFIFFLVLHLVTNWISSCVVYVPLYSHQHVLLGEALPVKQKTLSLVNKALLNYSPSRRLLKHPHSPTAFPPPSYSYL